MKFPLAIALSVLLCVVKAQGDIVDNFRLTPSNSEVLLSWDIVAGNTCDGISILRSTDGINFQEIELIEGICGSILEPIPYSHLDESPEDGWNYYKIQPGSFNESEVLLIELVKVNDNGHHIRPNPISDQGRIYFNNRFNEEHSIEIYGLNGKLVSRQTTELNYFSINALDLHEGIFTFAIYPSRTKNQVTSGKFVIESQH